MRLAGKSAIVTGSSRGIGAEIAGLFAQEGAYVVVNCIEDLDRAKRVLGRIREEGGKADLVVADVRSVTDIERMIESTVKVTGKLDVLVNNAGIVRDSLLENMSFEQWSETIETNLGGVFNCSKVALKTMKKQGHGKIINISSVVAQMGNIGQANYVASKAGIIGLTKSLALEYARYGILVNAIAPGFCNTHMTASIPEKVKEKLVARIALGRFAEPQEIARSALFLASDECSYMTGQVLSINGGLYL